MKCALGDSEVHTKLRLKSSTEKNNHLRHFWRRWENNIKMCVKQAGCERVVWLMWAQSSV